MKPPPYIIASGVTARVTPELMRDQRGINAAGAMLWAAINKTNQQTGDASRVGATVKLNS